MSCLCPAGVATNIAEQIMFFGEPSVPDGPDLPVVDPAVVGELAADAITDERFLVLTAPEVWRTSPASAPPTSRPTSRGCIR